MNLSPHKVKAYPQRNIIQHNLWANYSLFIYNTNRGGKMSKHGKIRNCVLSCQNIVTSCNTFTMTKLNKEVIISPHKAV